MALRLGLKINRFLLPEFSRSLSAKIDISSNVNEGVAEKEEETEPTDGRYRLGQQSSINLNKKFSTMNFPAEVGKIRLNIEEQKLQPAMLPDYYTKSLEFSDTLKIDDRNKEGDNSDTFRNFEQSKTYSKVQLPLRASKLANPFPEPVKVMASHTVSDEEKAAQMFADSRAPKHASGQIFGMPNFKTKKHHYSTMCVRHFSKKNKKKKKKCKKMKMCGKEVCPKMFLPGCERPKRKTCKRVMRNKCKKQEAPYPSYSESCHEDIVERPSECKLCPWHPSTNPNFKPKKRKIHTTLEPREAGRVENIKENHEIEFDEEKTNFQEYGDTNFRYRTNNEANSTFAIPRNSYQCCLKKKPCRHPPPGPCTKLKKKKKKSRKNKKRDSRSKKDKKKKKPRKQKCMGFKQLMAIWMNKQEIVRIKAEEERIRMEEMERNTKNSMFLPFIKVKDEAVSKIVSDNMMEMRKKSKNKKKNKRKSRKPKCKKLRLPCKEEQIEGKCPKKKRPKPIKDCPPGPGGCAQKDASSLIVKTLMFSDRDMFQFPAKIRKKSPPKCPPKRKPKMRDCPPEGCGNKTKNFSTMTTYGPTTSEIPPPPPTAQEIPLVSELFLVPPNTSEYECKKKKKCPQVDYTKIKDDSECHEKVVKEETCPKVQIKKKRRKLVYKRGKNVRPTYDKEEK